MNIASAANLVRLHIDKDGFVWYGDDDAAATNTFLDVSDFLTSYFVDEVVLAPRVIHLLGTEANAGLIVQLFNLRAVNRDRPFRIRLGSPAMMLTDKRRHEPEAIMHQLWQPDPPINQAGHWHDMDTNDYPTYLMLHELRVGGHLSVPEVVLRIAPYHPAWMAVRFIEEVNEPAACRLVAYMVDPRWFAHPFRPGRLSRLYAYLGLTRANMWAYLSNAKGERHFERAVTAVNVWYNLSGSLTADAPGDFLWRTFNTEEDTADGLLRATRRMVAFLAIAWLGRVQSPRPDGGFDPREFFRDDAEVTAFREHAKRWKPV